METNELILLLLKEVAELKEQIKSQKQRPIVTDNWIRGVDLKEWLNYENTQMSKFFKTDGLVVTQIGRSKSVLRKSFEGLLEKNIISNK